MMVANITLKNNEGEQIACMTIDSSAYYDFTCEGFAENAWSMADQMAANLSADQGYLIDMNIQLDLRD
jgi:hypothetical protein